MKNWLMLALCLATVACGDSEDGIPRAQVSVDLQFDHVIDAGPQDSTMLLPNSIAVGQEIVAVGDDGGPTIRVLDSDGRLSSVIGRKGSGPGEIGSIQGLSIWRDSLIAITDSRNQRLSVFDRSGTLINEITLRGARVGTVAFDANALLHVDRRGRVNSGADSGSATVHVFDRGGRVVREYGHYLPDSTPMGDPLLNSSRLAATSDGDVWQLLQYQGVLHRVGADGTVAQTIRLPAPRGRPAGGPFTEPVEGTPGAVMVVRMPVADDLAVDESGHIYVLVTQLDGTSVSTEVLTFDPQGAHSGTVELPRRAKSIRVHEGWLYALVDNQIGATAIDVYRIVKTQQSD